MKHRYLMLAGALAGVALGLSSGCDWSSSGTSFNTSKGAGVNINFSGVYNGQIDGKAVSKTSRGTITRLTISQVGNRVEVVDSQGSRYEGTVGSPGLIAQADSLGKFPPGAELVQAQINWAGKDEVAAKDIEFVGVIHAVSVTEIDGERTVVTDGETVTDTETDARSDVATDLQTRVVNNGVTTTTTEILTIGAPGDPFYSVTTTTTTTQNSDGRTLSRTVTQTGNDSRTETDTRTGTTTTTTEFTLTEANVQYRIEGTWIEKDSSIVARVDALSRGTFGIISIVDRGSQEVGTETATPEPTTTP